MPRAIKKAGTFRSSGWDKMIDGKRMRVHCRDLGLAEADWTEARSYQAAIAHWERLFPKRQSPVEMATDQIRAVLTRLGLEGLDNLINQGHAARQLIDIVGNAGPGISVMEEAEHLLRPNVFLPLPAIQIPGPSLPSDEKRAEHVQQLKATVLAMGPIETVFTLRHHAKKFLDFEQVRITRANTFGDLMDYIPKLVDKIGPDTDARTINEQTVTSVNLWLRKRYKTVPTRKKVWGFFKRIVRHLWSERLFEMPRNLDEKKFGFKVMAKKVKRYDLEDVREFLKKLPERLKLYALLGLNCGMTGMDIASFTKNQLDTKNWRITRKRTKTEETEDVPEVSYRLWPITVRLLKKYMADHPTLCLTSKTNTPLLTVWIDEATGKKKKKDLISLQWKRKKLTITFKAFRSIGATVIGDEKEKGWGRYYHHFLAHSPKSIADRHYVPPSEELFDDIMKYVGDQLGIL